MSKISTHVLDLSLGRPAVAVAVRLEFFVGAAWQPVSQSATDPDGRCARLTVTDHVEAGTYRITFETGAYFSSRGGSTLYPEVTITFEAAAGQSYHIPLLLSPFGYSTYRGS